MAAIATKVNNAVPATKYAKVGDLISGNLTAFPGTNTITLTITDPTGDSAVINQTLPAVLSIWGL